jgi:hypothetical protein
MDVLTEAVLIFRPAGLTQRKVRGRPDRRYRTQTKTGKTMAVTPKTARRIELVIFRHLDQVAPRSRSTGSSWWKGALTWRAISPRYWWIP